MKKNFKTFGYIFLTFVITLAFGNCIIHMSALESPAMTNITYCVSSDEGRLLLKWELEDADGYELNISQNNTFNKNSQILEYGEDVNKASLSDLPCVTYYIRIRTFIIEDNQKIYSDWSDVSIANIHRHYFTRTISQKPTCTENGTYTYKCECGRCYKMPINKFGHDYELITNTDNVCTELKCKRCNDIKESTTHDYELTKTIESTCETPGCKEYTCKNCGNVYDETIEKLNHSYEKVKETTTEITYACPNCKDSYVETKKQENVVEQTKDKTYTIDLGNGKTTTVVGHYEEEMQEEVFDKVNEYRQSQGLSKLEKASSKLQEAADIRSTEIVYKFEHYRPNGEQVLISFKDSTSCCAENIARYQKTAEEVMTDWKNSPSHNTIMISKYPKSLAVSIFAEKYAEGKYLYHFVQLFGW